MGHAASALQDAPVVNVQVWQGPSAQAAATHACVRGELIPPHAIAVPASSLLVQLSPDASRHTPVHGALPVQALGSVTHTSPVAQSAAPLHVTIAPLRQGPP